MQRGDHGLGQIGARRALGVTQPLEPARYPPAVPSAPVLVLERHQHAGVVDPGRAPRIMQQHQGGQGVRLRLIGQQRAQLAAQPYPFVTQVVPNRRRARVDQ